jgi:hypothetical protein
LSHDCGDDEISAACDERGPESGDEVDAGGDDGEAGQFNCFPDHESPFGPSVNEKNLGAAGFGWRCFSGGRLR